VLAVRCHAYGPPEDLVVEEIPDPHAGPDEVVVRVEAASVNFPDVLIAANGYQISIPTPFTPGSEFAGVVEAVGDGVVGTDIGDRVYGSRFVGAFAQRVVVPETSLSPVPTGVSLADAAAFWVVYATAYHSLRSVAEVVEGEWVVVLGAAGGVGLATVDLAQVLGARVLAAASSDEKLAVCAARGAEAVVNYSREDLKSRVKELTGGADVVIDPVGGPYAEQALRATRWGGRFVTVGFASGEIPRIPLNLVLLKGVVIKGFEIRTFGEHAPAASERDRAELLDLFGQGRIRPLIAQEYALSEVADAMRSLTERRATGKVIIAPWS
jgi:NADPH:quinone reductase-like Zn-dependent oxidoreductase